MTDTQTTPGGASLPSFEYLETLWTERTDDAFPREKFEQYGQLRISVLIDGLKARPALPTISDDLMKEIEGLALELGESYEPRDRGQAARIVRSLRKRANARRYHAEREAANAELDDLLVPAL